MRFEFCDINDSDVSEANGFSLCSISGAEGTGGCVNKIANLNILELFVAEVICGIRLILVIVGVPALLTM